MSSFDTARDVRIPGLVLGEVFIDPKLLSVRMKNMVKEMLRSGRLKGGWSSKSKQLAKKLVEGTDIMVVDASSRGVRIPDRHTYSDAIAEEVCALIDADEALELMDDNHRHRNQTHLEGITARTREQHNTSRYVVHNKASNHGHRWCYMFSAELAQQICTLFAATRSPAQIEAAEKLCDMLDNNTPIPVTLSM